MYKKSFWRTSKYKRLVNALAVVGSFSYLLAPTNIASAEEFGYDDEEFPPQYLDLDQFVITADRTPVNKWTTPANIVTITDKDIEANHYQTLAEALNNVNGIIVPYASDVPIINGLEKVLILIDGHQLYNDGVDNRDTVELSAIPSMKNIKRIEIVKGGGSSLYGSDAVTGIINIITKKGETDETTFDVNVGSWHQRNYEITSQNVHGDFGWFITGGVHESNPFNYPGDVARIDNYESRESDYADKDFTARFDYQFDDRNSLTLSGFHSDHKYNRAQEYTYNPDNLQWSDHHKSMTYNNLLLVYNFKENTQTPGWLRYFNDYKARDGYDDDRIDDTEKLSYDRISTLKVQGVDYQNSWLVGRHKLVTGVEVHRTSVSHWSWEGDKHITNQALYLQDTINMRQKWKIIPGLRYDHNSKFDNQVSPKIALNYRPDEKTKIYTSWGRIYKAATPYQLYFKYEGNENLKPEKGDTAILGFEHEFNPKTNLNMNLFYANLKDAIDVGEFEDENGDEFYQYTNVKNQKSRGIGLNWKHNVDSKWSYDIGYTYTHVSIDDFTPDSNFTQPRNTYAVGVHYDQGMWKANLFGVMGYGMGHFKNDDGVESNIHVAKHYAVLNFNLSCQVHDAATLYFKLNNLTNQKYSFYGYDNSYNSPTARDKFYISPGRSFIAGLDVKF